MNQKFTLFAFALTVFGIVKYADLTSKPSSTPGGGYAGEPAMSRTCASSNCHSGSTITDATQFSLKMAPTLSALSGAADISASTTFIPDSTYYMSMQLTGTGSRYGFSLSSLTSTNTQAGSFVITSSTTTTTVTGASGITNMSHKSANTTKSWVWKWKAPATAIGVNLYYAGMLANGDNKESGDIVYKSSVSITGQVPNAISEINTVNSFNVYPTQTLSDIALNLDANESIDATILLVNMTGQVVRELYTGKVAIGENNMRFNIADLPTGNYILSLTSAKSSIAKHIVKL